MLLEIACFNLESVLIAQQGGADRVELCDNIHEGGTTPDIGIARQIREQIDIALYVMIRPRAAPIASRTAISPAIVPAR